MMTKKSMVALAAMALTGCAGFGVHRDGKKFGKPGVCQIDADHAIGGGSSDVKTTDDVNGLPNGDGITATATGSDQLAKLDTNIDQSPASITG